jgi:hypothetical protein
MGGKKFAWVPIRRESLARDDATCDKAKHGCNNDTGAEDAFMHAGLEANVCAHSEKEVVPASMASTSEPINAYIGLSPRGSVKDGTGVQLQQTESDQFEKGTSSEVNLQNGGDIVSSSTSQKPGPFSTRTNSVMRSSGARTSPSLSQIGLKSGISTSMQCGNSSSGGSQKVAAVGVRTQQISFSARDKIFAPKTRVCQYRPGNLGDTRIKSVVPGTKPGLRWCPTGLTHTQKRWVQRLRALVIQEEISEKRYDEWFSQDRPIMPLKMTWRKKLITTEENKNADDTIAARYFENNRDAPTDMDVDQGG